MSIEVNNLAGAYGNLLSSCGITLTSDDLLVQSIDDVDKQVLVEGKPLAVPTADIVNNYTDSIVLFHPLCENLLLGESPVLQEFRQLIMDFLSDRILKTVDALLSIAIDEDLSSKLTPHQMDLMRATAGADATTLKNWRAIMRRAESRGTARIITIFLKRGASLNDETYKRAAIVNFNLYAELTDSKLNIFGAKIRKVDAKVYAKILEAIFDNIFIIDTYSAGSNALTAPYFDALIRAYYNVLKSLNGVTYNLRKAIKETGAGELHVNTDFMEPFKDLMRFRDVLPTMPYNDGDRQERRSEDSKKRAEFKPDPIPVHELPGVSSLSRQSTPYYEPVSAVVEQPVEQPQYNNPPANPYYQQPAQHQPVAHAHFPSLEEQLAGVPLGGYPPFNQNAYGMPPPPGYPGSMQMNQQFNPPMGYPGSPQHNQWHVPQMNQPQNPWNNQFQNNQNVNWGTPQYY